MKGKQAPGVQPSKASDLITAPCVSERPSRGRAYVSGFGGRAGMAKHSSEHPDKKAFCRSRWYDMTCTTLLLKLAFNEYLHQ